MLFSCLHFRTCRHLIIKIFGQNSYWLYWKVSRRKINLAFCLGVHILLQWLGQWNLSGHFRAQINKPLKCICLMRLRSYRFNFPYYLTLLGYNISLMKSVCLVTTILVKIPQKEKKVVFETSCMCLWEIWLGLFSLCWDS